MRSVSRLPPCSAIDDQRGVAAADIETWDMPLAIAQSSAVRSAPVCPPETILAIAR